MRVLRTIRLRLRSLFRGARVEQDLAAELRDHLERQIERHLLAGLSPAEARRAALREFGNVPLIQEKCRDVRRVNWVEELGRDLGYALRSMRRAPAYTAAAALSLALAIGANTAVFSLVNVLLLRPLAVADPHGLLEVTRVTSNGPGNFSYPFFERVRDQHTVFSGVLAVSAGTVLAAVEGLERPPAGRFVSGNFFHVLGLSPVVGRLLSPADDRFDAPHGSTLAVVSYGFWQRHFGEDAEVVGRTLSIDGVAFTVVGVLPRGFEGLVVGRPDDFFIPLASEPRLRRESWLDKPGFGWLKVAGRVKPGTSNAVVTANLDVIARQFHEEFPTAVGAGTADRRAPALTVESARAGLAEPRREFSRPILLLMGAVGFVLLIACANIVSLLLARGMARRRELGLRLAIGASRGRLVRQLLTESAALGLVAGAVGLALAVWGTPILAAYLADGDPMVAFDAGPDRRVLLFTVVVSLGTSLLAGLVPAFRLSRANVAVLPGDARPAGVSRTVKLWGRALIVAQVALSLLLLSGASLLVASLLNLRAFDAGFDRDGLVLIGLNPGKVGYTDGRRLEYYRQVLERARRAPGVRSASLSLLTPISGGSWDLSFGVEGRPRDPDSRVYVNAVADDYFATFGTRLLLGREFAERDGPDSPPVAIVNDALSRRYFGSESPIGRRVSLGQRLVVEVVGVVVNAKYVSLREEDRPTVYLHALQIADAGGLTLSVRAAGDPRLLAPAIRREVESAAPAVPIARPVLLTDQIDRSLLKERLMARVLGAFALLALFLACAGVYGVLGHALARRTHEFGVRFALGAPRGAVLRSVLGESATLAAAGVIIGVPATLALTRLLSSLFYGVTPADARVLGGAVSCLFIAAVAAAALPAWRASRVDPLTALRRE